MQQVANYRKGLTLMLAIAMVVGIPLMACAENRAWTTVGSAGTVDESNLSVFTMNGAKAEVKPTAKLPAALVIRYNIVAVEDLFDDVIKLAVCFLDNGKEAQVIVALKQYELATGATSTLLILDSNAFSSSGSYQLQVVDLWNQKFNFEENAYFIEAQLKKTGAKGTPGLAAIKINTGPL